MVLEARALWTTGRRMRHVCVGLILTCGLIAAAPPPRLVAQRANVTKGCVERFDATTDYFPDKAAVEDATTFSVEYRRSYKVVRLKEAYPGGPPEQYVLVQCGTPVPTLTGALMGAQVVSIPITSLFAFSTTHLPLLVDLDRVDVLTGVAQRDAVTSPEVQARLKAGQVVEFAKVGLVIDVERVVSARPSLLMVGGTANATLAVIRHAGVPVVANSEWIEPTALGRAEWLKYMALFLNEERKAQTVYGAMKHRYLALSARATARPEAERPLVMAGKSARGQFSIAGGRSYVAALIKDAGGDTRGPTTHPLGMHRSISRRRSGGQPSPTSGSTAGAGPIWGRCSRTNPGMPSSRRIGRVRCGSMNVESRHPGATTTGLGA